MFFYSGFGSFNQEKVDLYLDGSYIGSIVPSNDIISQSHNLSLKPADCNQTNGITIHNEVGKYLLEIKDKNSSKSFEVENDVGCNTIDIDTYNFFVF